MRRYGDRGLLCDLGDPSEVAGLAAAAGSLDGVSEVVPGARTLLVLATDAAHLHALESALAGLPAEPVSRADADEVEVRVDEIDDKGKVSLSPAGDPPATDGDGDGGSTSWWRRSDYCGGWRVSWF